MRNMYNTNISEITPPPVLTGCGGLSDTLVPHQVVVGVARAGPRALGVDVRARVGHRGRTGRSVRVLCERRKKRQQKK